MTAAGLCSITFRDLPVDEIIDAAAAAGLAGIEWGADRHVLPGSDAAAVAARCADAGLECPSYGTYLLAGKATGDDIEAACATAVDLGAPNLRFWAPNEATDEAVAELADRAADHGLTVSLEFHPGTRTETAASTLEVLAGAARPNLFTYWQPLVSLDDDDSVAELVRVAGRLSHLHVYRWGTGFTDRYPLADGASLWEPAIAAVPAAGPWTDAGRDRWAFLEYVRDDDPRQLVDDAATLRAWLDAGGDDDG